MSTDNFHRQIKGLLDDSLTLPGPQAERLRAARERALHRQRVSEPKLIGAWPSKLGDMLAARATLGRVVAPAAIVVAALVGFQQYRSLEADREVAMEAAAIADVDSALLKSDLPIDAFLDASFRTWLKDSGQ